MLRHHNRYRFIIGAILLVVQWSIHVCQSQEILEFEKRNHIPDDEFDFLSDDYIDFINKQLNTSWRAGRNFDSDASKIYIQGLMGTLPTPEHLKLPNLYHRIDDDERLPDEFDSRKKWPKCKTINEIRDQGPCGSCWAFGAAEAMSDRVCIGSNGRINVELSPEDLVSCCHDCGAGCNGGFPAAAWSYFVHNGLVSGGLYGNHHTCQPYVFAPCEHHMKGKRPPCSDIQPTPKCQNKCDKFYNHTYNDDKHYGRKAYSLTSNPEHIMKDIMVNGPVEADFSVYEDFLQYKSGVYQRHSHKFLGGHAIRILGWGIDANSKLPYWLCANSWNTDWGEAGFFRMLRGHNECDIEEDINAGIARISKF